MKDKIKGIRKTLKLSRTPAVKGQMFLIGSIMIIIGLIMLKSLLAVYSTVEEARFQESHVLDKQINNIIDEYKNTVGIASLQSDINNSGIDYLSNFSLYIRDEKNSEILYMFIFADGTNQKYYITLGNFLKDIINATINVTNSTPVNFTVNDMDDKKNYTQEFQSDINGTIGVTLTYLRQDKQIIEFIPITVSTNNFVAGFFDIKLKSRDMTVRIKDVYNRTW